MVRLADTRPREGITLTQFLEQVVPDEEAAEAWFVARRCPEGVRCAHCDCTRIAERENRRPQPYWCHDRRRYFSVRRERLMLGPIEVDETYIGGWAKNLHASQRDGKRGVGGKYPVVGILDRVTGEVHAEAVYDTKKDELQGYLERNVRSDATVYSDEMRSYEDLPQALQHSTGEYVRARYIPFALSRSGRC